MDNNYRIWNSFNNEYWPADYFIDATGRIRYHQFGEGDYQQSETWIRSLLEEAHHQPLASTHTKIAATGIEAAPDSDNVQSPETYIGYERAQNFVSPGGFNQDDPQMYLVPTEFKLNQWALAGNWKDEGQVAALLSPTGSIVYRFHARDLNLVLGPAQDGKSIRFRVALDGKAPGLDHGVDTDTQGYGVVKEDRLYELIRQRDGVRDRTFRIGFLNPGVQAYSFTFG